MSSSYLSSVNNTSLSLKPSKTIRLLLMVFLVFMTSNVASAQTQTYTYTTPGTNTFTVPCGVTSITVEVWGAGGAGGGSTIKNIKGGAGGAGGSYASSVITGLTSGQIIQYYVGSGASGAYSVGANGEGSWAVNNTTVFAQGGAGGAAPNGGNVSGGVGSRASSYGDILTAGTSGGNGSSTLGAAGGAGANPDSGAGGGSRNSENDGNNGTSPGGGGGGAFIDDNTNHSGGNGGNGQVKITYTSLLLTYCTPSFNSGVEPITNVTFAGINKTTTNALGGSSLETFCITGSVIQGSDTNVISVKGNTDGLYTDSFKVYIDWDQNGAFDTNEITDIGTIYNSTGIDALVLTGNIKVPPTAILGTTKMRVVKVWNNSTVDACFSGSYYGQAEDYLINVTSPIAPTVGTITQPNCVTITGSVVLSGLPSGSWTINVLPITSGLTGISSSSNTTTVAGLSANTDYTFTVTNSNGCKSLASSIVPIKPVLTTTLNGTTWTTTPDKTMIGIINSNTPITTNVELCSCTVNTGINAVVASGVTLKLQDKLTVSGTGTGAATLTFNDTSSLVQINDVTNSGNITYKRNSSSAITSDYSYWSSPVANQTLNISPSYASGMFYSYDDFATPEGWKKETAATSMQIGKGYIIRGSQTTSPPPPPGLYYATFYGAPNNGTKTIAIGPTGKSNLIGNPYPSAIDANKFLTANSAAIDGTLYFWTHSTSMQDRNLIVGNNPDGTPKAGSGALAYTTDDYASYNLTGGVGVGNFKDLNKNGILDPGEEVVSNRPTGYIGAGQAFFTTSTATGGSVTFNNAMRLSGTTLGDNTGINQQFFKTKSSKEKTTNTIEKNRIWLNLTNDQGAFKQTLVGYIGGATNDIDNAFDGESFDGQEFIDFYSVNQDKNLTIQGRALPFDENDTVPLGFRSTIEGPFTINIDQTDGLLTNQAMFLEDKLTNTVFDLKNGNYTFNTTAGTFNDRFVLRYTNSKTLGKDSVVAQENKVFVSVKNKQIKINSTSESIDKVMVYDLLGRQIYQKNKVNSNEFLITDFSSSHQTWILKTTLQNGRTVTEKIIY